MQTIKPGDVKIPTDVCVCPICNAELYAEITEWEQQEDGSWAASESGIHLHCTTEPEMSEENDDWDEWFKAHYSMPYVHWLPLETPMYKWMLNNYRFILR